MVKYGLIGRHLGHSFSARYFNDKFKREGLKAEYAPYEIDNIDELRDIIRNNTELRGLNVTIPFKQEIIHKLHFDFLEDECREIGAVNTVKIIRTGNETLLEGYNTDIRGFEDSLRPLLGGRRDVTSALILGAGGGAAKAVDYVLREKFGMKVTGVSRHPHEGRISYADITKEIIAENPLIVNCTPLGMWPDTDSCPDIPYQYAGREHIGYDLIYNPEETLFMKKMSSRGAICRNGIDMLYGQAEASWRIWNL